ncbi:MAG: hypothetical protein LBD11_06360 [Candidatus Peribacteria bacterium]|jgi:hypothetical protein|nr:hypothetical protein [Candidatus Peribacteria bacterium]
MKKWMITLGVVVVLAGCIALYAKDTSGKRDALLVAACNAATAGELRYGSGCAEYCDGTNWIPKFGCSATTQTVACSSKPDNAVYNGSGLVTSTRNGTEWTPSLVASYSATSSGNTCTFHCDTDAIYDSLLNLCRVERADCETTPLGGAIGAALAASGYVIAGCNVGALTGWNPSTMTPTIVNTTTSATYGYHFQWGNNFGFDARPGASVVLSNMDEYVDTLNYGPLSGGYYSRDIFVRVTDGANRNDRSLDQNDGLWGNAGSELERQ